MSDNELAVFDGGVEVPIPTKQMSKVNLRKIQMKKIILAASSSKGIL
jgi:hypothetical protein